MNNRSTLTQRIRVALGWNNAPEDRDRNLPRGVRSAIRRKAETNRLALGGPRLIKSEFLTGQTAIEGMNFRPSKEAVAQEAGNTIEFMSETGLDMTVITGDSAEAIRAWKRGDSHESILAKLFGKPKVPKAPTWDLEAKEQ